MSQQELALAAGISQGTLSKIEQGLREPSGEQTAALAKAMRCLPSFFSQAEREYGPPMSTHAMWRKKASVGAKAIDRTVAEFNVRIAHIRTLLRAVDWVPELELPRYELDDFDGSPAAVAAAVRLAWYVPRGPIRSLADFVERAGCVVVRCDLDQAQIDGVSYQVPGLPPVIFLNRRLTADRERFTLAHELGHLVMHRFPSPDMEQEANEFASALLMPAEDIAPSLTGLTLARAAQLKPVWRVSMAALIYRAKALQAIDTGKAEYLWRQMSLQGFRLQEPVSTAFPHDELTCFPALLQHTVQELGYTQAELEGLLHLGYEELADMYGLERRAGLRLVK